LRFQSLHFHFSLGLVVFRDALGGGKIRRIRRSLLIRGFSALHELFTHRVLLASAAGVISYIHTYVAKPSVVQYTEHASETKVASADIRTAASVFIDLLRHPMYPWTSTNIDRRLGHEIRQSNFMGVPSGRCPIIGSPFRKVFPPVDNLPVKMRPAWPAQTFLRGGDPKMGTLLWDRRYFNKGETYQFCDYFSRGGFFMGRHFDVTPAADQVFGAQRSHNIRVKSCKSSPTDRLSSPTTDLCVAARLYCYACFKNATCIETLSIARSYITSRLLIIHVTLPVTVYATCRARLCDLRRCV